MPTQLNPNQVKGLTEAYQNLEKLSQNSSGIKLGTFITAVSSAVLAIVGVITLIIQISK